MTPTECSTFLRKYNEWRRSDAEDNRESEMPHPREIGVAIDTAIQLIEQRDKILFSLRLAADEPNIDRARAIADKVFAGLKDKS